MKIITFYDKHTPDLPLITSSNRLRIETINAFSGNGWKKNAWKLKYLYDALQHQDPEELILVSDAFDVILLESAEEIERRFETFNSDVLFSAEANFYFRHPRLQYYYWKYYPRSDHPYDYLNSGNFMGKASALLKMLELIKTRYQLGFEKQELLQIRSDQYLYSRFYVDNHYDAQSALTIQLDHAQFLFGCTGGSLTALPFKWHHKIGKFLFFKYERKLLKSLGLEHYQQIPTELRYDDGKYINTLTGHSPAVLHLPASRKRFFELLTQIQTGNKKIRNTIAAICSLLAMIQTRWVLMYLPSS
jgi:hypothetical protein